jgi:hypothetical protein
MACVYSGNACHLECKECLVMTYTASHCIPFVISFYYSADGSVGNGTFMRESLFRKSNVAKLVYNNDNTKCCMLTKGLFFSVINE